MSFNNIIPIVPRGTIINNKFLKLLILFNQLFYTNLN